MRSQQPATLMLPLGFPEDGGKGAPADANALLDASNDVDLGSVAGDAAILAVNPHFAGAIVDFIHASTERAEGTGSVSGNDDVLVRVTSWIAVDLGNGYSCRTAGEQKRGCNKETGRG